MKRPSFDQQVTFLATNNLARTAPFYTQILGLRLVLDQGSCQIFQVSANAFIGFCEHLEFVKAAKGVILTLVSQEVDAWYAYLQSRSVAVEKPPQLNQRFNIYHLFLRDPDGYLVEIQQFLDPAWPGRS